MVFRVRGVYLITMGATNFNVFSLSIFVAVEFFIFIFLQSIVSLLRKKIK
jgi:hypothetical protein